MGQNSAGQSVKSVKATGAGVREVWRKESERDGRTSTGGTADPESSKRREGEERRAKGDDEKRVRSREEKDEGKIDREAELYDARGRPALASPPDEHLRRGWRCVCAKRKAERGVAWRVTKSWPDANLRPLISCNGRDKGNLC